MDGWISGFALFTACFYGAVVGERYRIMSWTRFTGQSRCAWLRAYAYGPA